MANFASTYLKLVFGILLTIVFAFKLSADIVITAKKLMHNVGQCDTKKMNASDTDDRDGAMDGDDAPFNIDKHIVYDWISPMEYVTNAICKVHFEQSFWDYIQIKSKDPFLSIETPPPDNCI